MEVQEVREWVSNRNEEAIFWDYLDECIIGMSFEGKVIYSIPLMVDHFMQEGMDEEEAMEHISYNILGAYVGTFTPIHIYPLEDMEVQ